MIINFTWIILIITKTEVKGNIPENNEKNSVIYVILNVVVIIPRIGGSSIMMMQTFEWITMINIIRT